MGYHKLINKPNGIDSKFKPMYKDFNQLLEDIDNYLDDLIVFCLSDEPCQSKDLRIKVKYYVRLLNDKAKWLIMDQYQDASEKYICFSGWEYSRPDSDFNAESAVKMTIRELMLLKNSVKTPDYFDDTDKFYTKVTAIKDALDLEDSIIDIVNHEFIEHYRDLWQENEATV